MTDARKTLYALPIAVDKIDYSELGEILSNTVKSHAEEFHMKGLAMISLTIEPWEGEL